MNIGIHKGKHQPVQIVKEGEQKEPHLPKSLHLFPRQSREYFRRVVHVLVGVYQVGVVGEEGGVPEEGGEVSGEEEEKGEDTVYSHLWYNKLFPGRYKITS